jgi:hypothetical protein
VDLAFLWLVLLLFAMGIQLVLVDIFAGISSRNTSVDQRDPPPLLIVKMTTIP